MIKPKSTPAYANISRLDRAIAKVAPGWGQKRVAARHGLGILSNLVERRAASRKGRMSNRTVRTTSPYQEGIARETLALKALEAAANDPLVAGLVRTIEINVIGKGLIPQSQPKIDILGITEKQARQVAAQAEWAFKMWDQAADVAGRLSFADSQRLDIRQAFILGETLKLMVMSDDPARPLSLAQQMVDPLRLKTPTNKSSDRSIRDGITLGPAGEPLLYHIADPRDPGRKAARKDDFKSFPARRGHRWVCMHRVLPLEPEQIRGISLLAPVLELADNLGEYAEMELAAAITSANFSVYLESMDGSHGADVGRGLDADENGVPMLEYKPGQVYAGPHKPHLLSANRPPGTYDPYTKSLERRGIASQGLSSLLVSQDFSETNYSAMRGAVVMAGKLFGLLQAWEANANCQPVWAMAFEEHVLRGVIELPGGVDQFYDNPLAWVNANWRGPRQGLLDPNKEMAAYEKALENHILSLANIHTDMGLDHEETLIQRAREVQELQNHGLWFRPKVTPTAPEKGQEDDDDDEGKEQ